jgi:hypothetical protein
MVSPKKLEDSTGSIPNMACAWKPSQHRQTPAPHVLPFVEEVWGCDGVEARIDSRGSHLFS